MATIRKREDKNGNVSYHVQIRLKGYPTQTASFERLTDAKKWAASTESAIREGRHFKTAESKKHTLADAIARYKREVLPHKPKSAVHYTIHLDWFNDAIGYTLMADITPATIAECREKLLSETTVRHTLRSPTTANRYLSTLSTLFTVAVNEWLWMTENPMTKVKKPKESRGRVRFLDDDERARLLDACQQSQNEILYLCVILALSTGMRQGELMNLYWKTPNNPPTDSAWGVVELDRDCIVLHETKNGDRRRVPLVGHAKELLKQHAKVRRLDSDLVFPGDASPDKPISFKRCWGTALKQAGIDNFKWHDLRHCTASYLAMNGASLAEIAEVLGHKTLQMVKRYAHLSDGHVSSVVESMNNKLFGNGG